MSKKEKRLREFEKNNRVFNIEEARKKREEKYKDRRSEKAAQAAYLQDMGQDRGDGAETDAATEAGTGIDLSQKKRKRKRIANVRRLVTFVVIVLFVVSIGFSAVRLIQLKSEKDKLEKLNEELTQMKEDLSVEAQLVNSAEYMEQQARETLRMIKDGELLFIISDENPSQEEQTQ